MDKEFSQFTISQLLDALYMARTSPLDSSSWREQQAAVRNKIIAELESRPVKELVQALVYEALR